MAILQIIMINRFQFDAPFPPQTKSSNDFDQKYSLNVDPWNYRTSWYEKRKYAQTIAALPRERYRNAFEPGCSIGELTKLLATRCDQLLSVDCSSIAVQYAQNATADLKNVQIKQSYLPEQVPEDIFDLIVASEILYYFSFKDLDYFLSTILGHLEPNGHFISVHWRARQVGYGYDGYNVHTFLTSIPQLIQIVHLDDDNFVLDVMERK